MSKSNKKLTVVNFFGAPCAGKTTAASGLFTLLKRDWVNVEQALEHAKDLVLSDTEAMLQDQALVLANQHHKLHRLVGKANIAVTDSPLILSALYAPKRYPASFLPFVLDLYNRFDNVNYYLHRDHPYSTKGRVHTEQQATKADRKLLRLLKDNGVVYQEVQAEDYLPERIFAELKGRYPTFFPRQSRS